MVAKTEHIYLSGKSKWTKTVQPDKYGAWSTVLYLDPASKLKFQALREKGVLNEIKTDDDGDFVSLRRKTEVKLRTGGTRGLTPVVVVNKDGTPFEGYIGNGSDVTCKVEMYSYKDPFKAGVLRYAIRLLSIRVDNLVAFEPHDPQAFDPDRAKLVEGLKDAPEPIF